MQWNKVTLVGVGLLGGSLGLALKRRKLARQVTGFVRRAASVKECVDAGAADETTRDLAEAVRESDLIVLCTPLAQMKRLLLEMKPALKRGALITDVGSVKGTVVRELEALAAGARAEFIGSHPMAGSEKTGVAAAREDLFENAICVVTPTRKTRAKSLRAIMSLWADVGARVLTLTAATHDSLVSRSSHLPHLLAAEITALVLGGNRHKHQGLLCANGFRDTTRIASGSPEMWRDIALANRTNLARDLGEVIHDLQALRKALKQSDPQSIEKFLDRGKQLRDDWAETTAGESLE